MTSLDDAIVELAARLRQDAALAYLRARVERELAAIEAILAQGVSIRKLALALSEHGVQQVDGQPLSPANLRQLVSRARKVVVQISGLDRRERGTVPARSTPPLMGVPGLSDAVLVREVVGAPDFSADPLGLRRRH